MESALSRFLVGLSVKISRSDGERKMPPCERVKGVLDTFTSLFGDWLTGRVHSATVTSADDVKSTAMVEWYERKICRGKEVSGSQTSG